MSNLAERSKVNLDLWNLFIAIITSENNEFGSNNFQIHFSILFPFKCIRKQI